MLDIVPTSGTGGFLNPGSSGCDRIIWRNGGISNHSSGSTVMSHQSSPASYLAISPPVPCRQARTNKLSADTSRSHTDWYPDWLVDRTLCNDKAGRREPSVTPWRDYN